MPKFSIVVPVYNVAPYLHECLDSVLNQTYTDWECICVDDGSTDGSGEILDEYALKDNRFKVIHQKNQGVSAARNAALDVAGGEWICFLDSDDKMLSTRLASVNECINEYPEVDVVRMAFQFWDGGDGNAMISNCGNIQKRVIYGSDACSCLEELVSQMGMPFPNIIRSSAVKEVRFILGLPCREDSVFLLEIAQRIHGICICSADDYLYRRRMNSSYHGIQRCDAAFLAQREVNRVFAQGGKSARAYAFLSFKNLEFWLRHCPNRSRDDVDKVCDELEKAVKIGALDLSQLSFSVRTKLRIFIALRKDFLMQIKGDWIRMIPGKLSWVMHLLRDLMLAPVIWLMPRQHNKIIFGAWCGEMYGDNPKYFLRYIAKLGKYKCYWIGNERVKDEVEKSGDATFVRKDSIAAFWHYITAKYMVCNINPTTDLLDLPNCGRMTILNFWHGIPLKRIGGRQFAGRGAQLSGNAKRSFVKTFLRGLLIKYENWLYSQKSYTTVSSQRMVEIMHDSLPLRFDKSRTICCGMPRNDYLIQNAHSKEASRVREKYAKLLGLPVNKRWYLYLPTWRHTGVGEAFSFVSVNDMESLQRVLNERQAIIIEKQHPKALPHIKIPTVMPQNIHILSNDAAMKIDVQELLLASDRLITDYSSCFFDFETMNRPVIHFAYDYEEYATIDTGLEYELDDVAAGPIAKSEDSLLKLLSLNDEVLLAKKGGMAKSPVEDERGNACEKFVAWMRMG